MTGLSWPAFAGRLRRRAPVLLLAASAVGLGAGGAVGARALQSAIINGATAGGAGVRAALKLRLPKTPLGAIDCRGSFGLCEVVAGSALFYVDRSARFLVIGHVYDMERRSDLTAARLLDINPGNLIPPTRSADADERPAPTQPSAARIDPAELPQAGAIRWGAKTGPKLVVLSDFACGYCRRLTDELARLPITIEEHPISIFGAASRRLAEQVLCAADPVAALHAAYRGQQVAGARTCDVRGLDANEAFARAHGFGGTPVLIREDGAVLQGYRPAAVIKAFVEGRGA